MDPPLLIRVLLATDTPAEELHTFWVVRANFKGGVVAKQVRESSDKRAKTLGDQADSAERKRGSGMAGRAGAAGPAGAVGVAAVVGAGAGVSAVAGAVAAVVDAAGARRGGCRLSSRRAREE